ncbi:MAG TPA: BON domain-containing protein [Nitrospira sp.]|nr:BON domain-containing protein [Nitrospira sp.]
MWLLAVALLLVTSPGCVAKYKAMAEAAQSEVSPRTIAQDDRHKIHLHEALIAQHGLSGLTLSTYAFMSRGYVVGQVDNREQAEAVLRTARLVPGLRSVDGYLLIKESASSDSAIKTAASDLALKAQIESAVALAPGVVRSRVHIEVLNGSVLLLGVVSGDQERRNAEAAAAEVNGVRDVTDWLLLPEAPYMSIRSKVR